MTVFVNHGPGRSYEVDTGSLCVKFRALSRCELFPSVEKAAKDASDAQAWALLTDIGNNIMHGFGVQHLMTRIESAIERLHLARATVGVTSLPVKALAEIPPWNSRISRHVVYPSSRVPREEVLSQVDTIQDQLSNMESRGEIRLLPARREWHGPDGFHLHPARTRDAITEWIDLLLSTNRIRSHPEAKTAAVSKKSLYFNCRPEYRVFRSGGNHRDRSFVVGPGVIVRGF